MAINFPSNPQVNDVYTQDGNSWTWNGIAWDVSRPSVVDSGLATVATTGSYLDLTNKPTIPSLVGYATTSYVDSAVGGVQIPSLTGYATETYVISTVNAYNYTLPQATSSILGGVKVDNTTITATNGVITAVLPTASTIVKGGVKIDGTTITIANGTISAPLAGTAGQANGLATLDAEGKLTTSQLPNSLSGAIVYKGSWNASTNTPTLVDGTGTAGWEYVVSTSGTRNLGSGSQTFNAGDWVIYNGTIWEKIPSNTIAAAGTLTGTTLNSTVVNSSLTSVGTLTDLTVTNPISGTVANGVVTTGSYTDPSWLTLTAGKVGLGNVTNESKSTMFTSPTFTGTVSGVTATHVGLGNVTNESKSTMFTSPTFTGTATVATVKFADNTTMTTAPSAPGVVMVHHSYIPPQGLQGYSFATDLNLKDKSVYKRYQIHITGLRHQNTGVAIGFNQVNASTGASSTNINYTWMVGQQIYHNGFSPTITNLNGISGTQMQFAFFVTSNSYPSASDTIIDAEYFEYQANSGRWRFKCYSTAQYSSGYIRQESVFEYSVNSGAFSSFPGFYMAGTNASWDNYTDNIYKPTVTVYGYR